MRAHLIGVLLALVITTFRSAAAESLRLWGKHDAGVIVASPGVPARASIFFGWGETPITGAEFKVEGLPPGWIATISSSSAAAVIGSPFDGTGINVAFGECRSGASKPICEVSILATSLALDVVLRVTARTPPGNPDFDCPLVTLCDLPVFTKMCVDGSATCLNPVNIHCDDAVQPVT